MAELDIRSSKDRFQQLFRVISSDRFLNKEGLGNEVPFFICPYPPKDSVEMQSMEQQLVRKLLQVNVRVLQINLYDLSVELLENRGIWERILQIEDKTEKGKLKQLLQGPLDPEAHLIPVIAEKMQQKEFDVMFITGVGEVFPYIRSHNVLNNLQSTAKEQPTVMFFPGEYTQSLEFGASLDLFGRLHNDKYYRAFNIFHVEV